MKKKSVEERTIMKKKSNKTLIITTILCLLPVILAVLLYNRLPEQIAIHFDASGAPDNYLPKALAVFGLPVLMAVINLYTHFRIDNDPKSENASSELKQLGKWAVPLLSVIVMPITIFIALGAQIPIVLIITAIVGVVIILCGNYLPKCRRNYTVGIKLPWTLDNEDNWNKTHRFAGFIWVIGGLAFTSTAFFSTVYAMYIMLGIIILLVALPPVYSYAFYRKQQRK